MSTIVNGIKVEKDIFDPRKNLRVVFGAAADPEQLDMGKTHGVTMIHREHSDAPEPTITKFYQSRSSALRAFKNAQNDGICDFETHEEKGLLEFDDDPWAQIAYDWERDFVEPYAKIIDATETHAITASVCADYSIVPPTILISAQAGPSDFDADTNTITFGHNRDVDILHELGHAILSARAHKSDLVDEEHHGPAFVWIAIELYNRYLNLDLQYLTVSAAQNGLLGSMDHTYQSPAPISDRRPSFWPWEHEYTK